MITTNYENTYVSVNNARKDTADLDEVIKVLSKASAPMSCHDVGFAIWGVDYLDNRRRAAHMGQMLKHLREGGFLKVEEVKGEPIEVEYLKFVRRDKGGNPSHIRVHDDEGNVYEIRNPKYNGWCETGKWENIKKTVIPRIKVYSLAR